MRERLFMIMMWCYPHAFKIITNKLYGATAHLGIMDKFFFKVFALPTDYLCSKKG